MSESPRCEHCSHKCFMDQIPDCRDPKKRPKSIHILFNEINEKMSNGKKKNIAFYIFVEGDLDEMFWRKIKKSDSIGILRIVNPTCDTDSSQKGLHHPSKSYFIKTNKNAIECIFCKDHKHLLQKQYLFEEDFFSKNQAIGMVDMDFQRSLPSTDSEYDPDSNIQYDPRQFYPLFRTETRDLEILLCKYGGLHNFLTENLESDPALIKEIEQDLLNQASIIGYARFLNAEKKSYIKFKCLITKEGKPNCLKKESGTNPFCKYICEKKSLECADVKGLLENDNQIKNNNVEKFFKEFIEKCPLRNELIEDLWSICQGHDTMQILECMIRCGRIKCRNYPNRALISDKELSNMILEEFIKNKCYGRSEMIAEIITWEKNHHPSRFEDSSRGELFIKKVYREFNQNNADQNNPSFKNAILLK